MLYKPPKQSQSIIVEKIEDNKEKENAEKEKIKKYHILDLDVQLSINVYANNVDTKKSYQLIYQLYAIIKQWAKYDFHTSYIMVYKMPIKYLNRVIICQIEIDKNCQFINILYDNEDRSKNYLKIVLSINDEPTIKYVCSDKADHIKPYINGQVDIKPGAYLINFAHALLSFIGYDRTRLDDDSSLILNIDNDQIISAKLWLYCLLTKNCSFYHKFGYNASNVMPGELDLLITDAKNISLSKIVGCLCSKNVDNSIKNSNNNSINNSTNNASSDIIEMVGDYDGTLYDYTMSHSIIEFAKLTNLLDQNIFDNDYYFWYGILRKLYVANVCQTNNNIKNHFHRLK